MRYTFFFTYYSVLNIYLATFPVVLDHIFCFIDIAIVCLVVSCSQIISLVTFFYF